MLANRPSLKSARPRAILTIPELEHAKAAALSTSPHCILAAPTKMRVYGILDLESSLTSKPPVRVDLLQNVIR